MLCDYAIWLAERPNAHGPCICFHGMQKTSDSRGALCLSWPVEPEVVDVRRDEVNLSLEIVAEADDFRTALLRPSISDTAQLTRFQATAIKLRSEVGVQCVVEVILELAIQQTLLSGIEGNVDAVDRASSAVACRLKRCAVGL